MKTKTTLVSSTCAILALASPAFAQDRPVFQLPEQCSGTVASELTTSDVQDPAAKPDGGGDGGMMSGHDMGHGGSDGGMMSGQDMGHGDTGDGMMPGHDMGHGGSDGGMMSGHDMGHGDTGGGVMPEHVRQNMEKMRLTMPAMEQGMMQQDADVAFACGMIAHHQAAIDMAQVVLDHGQDAQMRRLAEEIIDLQADEIEVMTEWLETSAQ